MKQLILETKFAADGAGLITGYASLFGRPADCVNDVIEPGAFSGSLAAYALIGAMPEMLREHRAPPIGEWLELEEDDIGLRVKGRIDLGALAGRDAYEAVRSGKIDGLSLGYRATKWSRGADGERFLHEIELQEISLVRRPAASRARVLSVKSAPAGNPAAKGAALSEDKTMVEKVEPAPGGDPGNEAPTVEDRVAGLDTRLKTVEEKVGSVKSAADRIGRAANRCRRTK